MQADYEFSFSHVNVLHYNYATIKAILKKGTDWAERIFFKTGTTLKPILSI